MKFFQGKRKDFAKDAMRGNEILILSMFWMGGDGNFGNLDGLCSSQSLLVYHDAWNFCSGVGGSL